MADGFPTLHRGRRATRLGAITMVVVALLLAGRTAGTSLGWIGRPFPGFMVLDNRVVASIGLADWSGTGVANLFQSQVIAIDGRSVASVAELQAEVASRPVGTPVTYRLLRAGRESEAVVPTQRFGVTDWLLLFGVFLLNGITYVAAAAVVWVLSPSPLGRAFVIAALAWALFLLTAMDLYGPATFFRLHVAAETLLPPTMLQFVLLFPEPHRLARWRFAGYLPALVVLVLYEAFLDQPRVYSALMQLNMALLGVACFFLAGRLVAGWRDVGSELTRQRVRIVAIGVLLGLGLPGALAFLSAVFGGTLAINLGTITPVIFALAVAYAIVKHDLFELDAMVKRGAYYLLLTGAVGAAYAAAVLVFNLALPGSVLGSAAFPVLFTLAVLMVFNPLRTVLQGFVDRVFFRTRYDSAQVLEAVGADLASALTREHIAQLVRAGVERAIPNPCTRLFVGQAPEALREVGGEGAVLPAALVRPLAPGRVLTAFDGAESYPTPGDAERVRQALRTLGAEVAVPLWLHGALVGLLTTGPKRSGLFYTAGDADFLRVLAHQVATALQNAASYEELMALNASLEERVAERTAEVEAALSDLQHAQVQLVQSEKMASLGRLVAGVAHEINNPVSFIATSVAPLRRRIERAAAAAPPEAERLLGEACEIVDIMERGAERTTAIVQDLRTFSRLGEATRKMADLHDGLDTTLRLLEARWRERVTVHRDYGDIPPVECDPGQINQVFMNVLANACDAVGEDGNVWIETRTDGDDVEVVVRDDGPGMTPEVQQRVFDPFFTTKDVGHGTGLGLAISHQIMSAHGGRIEVESEPGRGATIRVRVPIGQSGSLDSVATAGR